MKNIEGLGADRQRALLALLASETMPAAAKRAKLSQATSTSAIAARRHRRR